jgi:hypothetical protein
MLLKTKKGQKYYNKNGEKSKYNLKKRGQPSSANPLISFGGAEGDRTPNLLNAMLVTAVAGVLSCSLLLYGVNCTKSAH